MSSTSISIYHPPTDIKYDGTNSLPDFLEKYNTIAAQYNWTEQHKCAMLRFYLQGAASEFYKKLIHTLAHTQGVPPENITYNWQELTQYLHNSFSGHESFEALDEKLRKIKLSTLGAEAFFFSVCNILDKLGITDTNRRIRKIINLLPTDIAHSFALSFPTTESDILFKLKHLDNYQRSINQPTTSHSATDLHLNMATDIAHAIINHLDYNPFTEEEDNISHPDEIDNDLSQDPTW
jgi:hypothetical protein